jgi:putative FmdB family regulatory protein
VPLYDYRCNACQAEFELLVNQSTVPACPQCAAADLERLMSLVAPQGTSNAKVAAVRAAAARQGHFSNYSPAERKKGKI